MVDDQGRAHFGYNQGGEWVDDNLHTILGAHAYLLHTGDVPFVRQILPALERMLAYFVRRRNEQGLFKLDNVGAHWYYDAINTSGVNGYYNAFFYKAACDLAEMEMAAGRPAKAAEYRELADSIQTAFQRVFWRDLPGGPRFVDWIDARGNEVAYFCDLCQWPPIAVGLATPEQGARSSPRRMPGSPNWNASLATRVTPACPRCGPCRRRSIRILGRNSART